MDKIHYHCFGAGDTVTGSKHLLTFGNHKVLVDSGLFQGDDEKLHHNVKPSPHLLNVKSILLTHAHLDHCGYLPALYRYGLQAPIYCTKETKELAIEIMLDSARILEHRRRETGEEILYDQNEVSKVISHFNVVSFDKQVVLKHDLKVTFRRASHILGASYVEINYQGRRVTLSGDLGHKHDPLILEPETPNETDVLFIESTYGNRAHLGTGFDEAFTPIFEKLQKDQHTIVIPAFSLARSQMMMFYLTRFLKKKNSSIPVYVDSTLTLKINEIYSRHTDHLKIDNDEWKNILRRIIPVEHRSQREKLLDPKNHSQKIILTSSGMMSGGLVSLYIDRYMEDPQAIFTLVGYQANGTVGRELEEGSKTISVRGQRTYQVQAEIISLPYFSSHADHNDLMNWIKDSKAQKVFLVHGSEESKKSLLGDLQNSDREVIAVDFDQSIEI